MKKLRVLYAGSPLASAIVLKNLIEDSAKCGKYEIAGVLTNPPSAKGRHKELIPTDVQKCAEINGIPAFSFEHLDSAAREKISPLACDILVCFDYGHIFGPKFLGLFPLGGINLHPSALPKYRGCTPVPAAILNGDSELGISVQKISLKTDEGDLLSQISVGLAGTETTESLMDGNGSESVVTKNGTLMFTNILQNIADSEKDGKFTMPAANPQNGESSYTDFIKKEDGIIDWSENAQIIDRKIRAYTPWPLCSTECNGVKLTILKSALDPDKKTDAAPGTVLPYEKSVGVQIACGDGSVLIAKELQWQGKKAMAYKDFMNGARNFTGSQLK